MRNICKIYKNDLKTICTNWAARLMIIVLILIPSLYSLINIKASWDPYANTGGLKIAIINNDSGTIFKDEDINLGDELVDKLKDNDKMGWEFVDNEEGKNGLRQEKYYATIEIPEDFSEDLVTLADKEVIKPKIIYTVNEKKNSIAPKLTDAGVKSVKNQLDENIIKTISGILFRICDETGVEIDNKRDNLRKIIDNIYELDEKMPELENLLNDTIDGTSDVTDLLNKTNDIIPTISNTVDLTNDFLSNGNEYLEKAQGDLADISLVVQEDLVLTEKTLGNASIDLKNIHDNTIPEVSKKILATTLDTSNATQVTVKDLNKKLNNVNDFLKKIIDYKIPKIKTDSEDEKILQVQKKLKKQSEILEGMKDSLRKISSSIESIIDKLNTIDDKLDILIPRLEEKISDLDNGKELELTTLEDIQKLVSNIDSLTSDIIDIYNSEVINNVDTGFDSINYLTSASLSIIEEISDTLPSLEELISTSLDATDLTHEELLNLMENFLDGKDKVHEIADKLRELEDEDKYDEIIDMITNDWSAQSDFLSSPVEIDDNRLFPVPNYGSASAPFYTVLCLWVGALIGSALLKLEPKEEEGIKYKSYEVYFGKLLIFLTIGVFQALVASLGSIYGLKSYVVHPALFVLYSVFVSFVFMVIVYTAASLLDDVGKALIVVVLVFQLAGTGGTFPIEVVPEMFQKIYMYFPFTYATNAMRQLVAGIVYPILIKDTMYLGIYMLISLISGVLLKGIMNKATNKVMKKLYKSGILRH